MKTITKPNPFLYYYVECQFCERYYHGASGVPSPILPDDGPGIVHGGGCCRECKVSHPSKLATRPTAWFIGAFVAALAFHVAMLIAINL